MKPYIILSREYWGKGTRKRSHGRAIIHVRTMKRYTEVSASWYHAEWRPPTFQGPDVPSDYDVDKAIERRLNADAVTRDRRTSNGGGASVTYWKMDDRADVAPLVRALCRVLADGLTDDERSIIAVEREETRRFHERMSRAERPRRLHVVPDPPIDPDARRVAL